MTLNNSDIKIINETDHIKALENFAPLSNSEQKPGHNLTKMKIYSLASENLCLAIKESSRANDLLSKRILLLNIILGAWTIAGTILGFISLYKMFFDPC